MNDTPIKTVQLKILEIMKFIDRICKKNDIIYYIMGGTALGAVRHKGFIPWDDDLDIFMTPDNYMKFKKAFNSLKSDMFVLQEWSIVDTYLEYAKVRMNGTTFIESCFKENKNMHHGIYVDIMILHKVPNNRIIQYLTYFASKYVVLVGLSQRNWKPKTLIHKLALISLNFLPNKILSKCAYKLVYKFDNSNKNYQYCYYITKANFSQGLFSPEIFNQPIQIDFENTQFLAPRLINEYLKIRYGDYLKMPSEKEQKISIHAEIFDTEKSYEEYLISKEKK